MHLVNPITSEQISLPSVTTIEQVTPICGTISFIRHTYFFDTSTESYMVVLIHNPFGQLSFARLGDEKWTWLPPHSNFDDCIYKDDLLYAVTLLGQIITFDFSGSVVTTKIIIDRKDSYGVERVYIVQDPLGDLLLVRRPQSLCFGAEEYPQVKPNHVYFTDDTRSVSLKCSLRYRLVIGMLNLKTKIMDEIVSPQPWSGCMAPLLIIPNPRKMNLRFHSWTQHSKY
ncbi:hypothetical protein HU200_003793 [Digitaria exilis]|uniref:KIB1-4 beta-propeller domain-containing protein n=1 Tax=Digitaria exilis TaxID=1010633 RepID=A0A835KVK1_9POAL|nr:hypothetical protein HU200_003793 [Digitaria exilis]